MPTRTSISLDFGTRAAASYQRIRLKREKTLSTLENYWARKQMWLNGLICACLATGWLALLGGSTHAQDVVGNAPTPLNEALPPKLDLIASSIPVLAAVQEGAVRSRLQFAMDLFSADVLGQSVGRRQAGRRL